MSAAVVGPGAPMNIHVHMHDKTEPHFISTSAVWSSGRQKKRLKKKDIQQKM